MNGTSLKHKSYSLDDSKLATTFESKNDTKTKISHHRVTKNGYIWEGISLMNPCWVGESVSFLTSFNCSPMTAY